MTKEEIQEYSLRVTQGNKSDLVVVTYDIILKYLEDARKEYQAGEKDKFVFQVKNCYLHIRATRSKENLQVLILSFVFRSFGTSISPSAFSKAFISCLIR